MKVLQRSRIDSQSKSRKPLKRFAAATLLLGSIVICAGTAIASPNSWRKKESGAVTESFKEAQDKVWAKQYIKEKTETLKTVGAVVGMIVLLCTPVVIMNRRQRTNSLE